MGLEIRQNRRSHNHKFAAGDYDKALGLAESFGKKCMSSSQARAQPVQDFLRITVAVVPLELYI